MNIPNTLSVFRILLIPFTAYYLYLGNMKTAFFMFLTAGLTDILDGYIARRSNMITDFGKIIDPIADKLMHITVLAFMAVRGLMPWAAAAAILVKESMMFLGGASLYRKNVVVEANWYGKAATVVTSACVAVILLFYEALPVYARMLLQWLPVLMAAFAFLRYLILYIGIRSGKNRDNKCRENGGY